MMNGMNMANLMLIFLMTQAMIGFVSFPPYFVSAILVVIPSRIGKTKNIMPNAKLRPIAIFID